MGNFIGPLMGNGHGLGRWGWGGGAPQRKRRPHDTRHSIGEPTHAIDPTRLWATPTPRPFQTPATSDMGERFHATTGSPSLPRETCRQSQHCTVRRDAEHGAEWAPRIGNVTCQGHQDNQIQKSPCFAAGRNGIPMLASSRGRHCTRFTHTAGGDGTPKLVATHDRSNAQQSME